MEKLLRIGISACLMHPDPTRTTFSAKTLLYFEESLAKVVLQHNAFPILLPRKAYSFTTKDILSQVDGLILQGGVDISPGTYNEDPLRPEWSGDSIRDTYELELIEKGLEMRLPILGICRGMQLINVSRGGTMYQDIPTQIPSKTIHRDAELYDKLTHEIQIEKGTRLEKLYSGIQERKIISVHHQAVKEVGKNLKIEALSKEDGIIEALRYHDEALSNENQPYLFGVQWHPEFQEFSNRSLMDATPLFNDFFNTVRASMKTL